MLNRPASFFAAALMAAAAVPSAAVLAHGYKAGALSIAHPWSRQTAPGQTVGGGFLVVTNSGAKDDKLVSVTSPVATEVQLHTMSMDGDVMRMRQVTGGLTVPAHGKLELKPGGFHVMFLGLKAPLALGAKVPATLTFQRAGKVKVEFAVEPITSTGLAPAMDHDHAGH
ncbi:copper chaperone PCu(A)C [Novosphingobium rhizosphaerae]|uniref:copper chaperone PCu(A)C n=1 Tax=Novosphingobium rhizosphaerae TaxID=1551649 RepID=UPI001859E66B